MSIKITFTEEEILSTSNYYDMGKKVHDRFWQAKRDLEGPRIDDEHVGLTINEDGLVTAIHRPDDYDTCIVCGKKTILKVLAKLVLILIIVINLYSNVERLSYLHTKRV
jgi:hypothetical protein